MADVISGQEITGFLSEKAENFYKVHTENSVGSTNEEVKALARKGEREGYVLVCENQYSGKGRMERKFFSPENTGIYMSVLLRPDMKPERALGITTMAAVAVCRALEEYGVSPQIKWVNDVFVNGRKVCGILTESAVDGNGGNLEYAVLGIGVNVYEPKDGFPKEIAGVAGAVFKDKTDNLRNRLCAQILNEIFTLYGGLAENKHSGEYIDRNFVVGKAVNIICNGRERAATIDGITDSCLLLVTYENGEKAVLSSGEISLRL